MLSALYAGTLRKLLPPNARRLVQVGCGDGTLATAYKQCYPASLWQGVERDAEAAALARRHCDLVHQANVDTVGAPFFAHLAMSDAWIFDQTLHHSADPLALLRRIRAVLAADACVLIVLPGYPVWANEGLPRADSPQAVAALLAQAGYTAGAAAPLATPGATPADGPAPLLITAFPA